MPLPRTWWVLTSFDTIPYVSSLLVHFHTYPADHMFMWWSYYNPTRKPVYRIIRGVRKFCGYTWGWKDPYTAEQIEDGNTMEHTIYLPHLVAASKIWFMVWAPDGPYGMNIQGPLMHVRLLTHYPTWSSNVCIATRVLGMWKTRNFSGPGPDQPTWTSDNHGLDSLAIWQACIDLNSPGYRRYIIAGGDLYIQETYIPKEQAWGHMILSNAQACTLTGSPSGSLHWVTTSLDQYGYVFVLFNSALTINGTWCIQSHNFGRTWGAYQIYNGLWNYEAGNIMAGLDQIDSPFRKGAILYCALCASIGGGFSLYFSGSKGESWSLMDKEGISRAAPRCLVAPSDERTVFMGVYNDPADTQELYRSVDYGRDLAEVDGAHHLGIFVGGLHGEMWIDPGDPLHARVLQDDHLWHTNDGCDNWIDPGALEETALRLAIQPHRPGSVYLARSTSHPPTPPPGGGHVIYISEDEGLTMFGKAGAHAHDPYGGYDSIPFNCGGVAHEGIHILP